MAAKLDPSCRLAGPIQLPNDLTFEEYIQNSFADELKVAGLYDQNAPIMLQGVIDDIRFSTTAGTWDFGLTLKSSNGKSIKVVEHYDFHTSFTAISACHNTADAFQPAVQALVGNTITAPDFQSLLQK
ncbi:MAG TPA: hypothetical protein VEJ16_07200 [Alphaproteobacteria bacterium]|nr:hypothetical protein [Alphaproteobacteria bacterium]